MTAATLTDAKPGWTPARMGVFALLVLAALWLGWKAWDVNITMSCWKNEWPNLPVCEEINGRTPQHADVLQLQADQALRAGRWAEALDPLTRLSRHHNDAEATRVLAELIRHATATPELNAALLAAAQADPGWMERPLRALPQAKVPTAIAMPLVVEMMKADALTPQLGLALIGQLKTEGLWLEAHAIWLRLWKRPLGYLFNGDFEQNFVAGGFDWEVIERDPHRGGARIDLAGRRERGQVLRVAFTGRAMKTPLVRQHLLLPPGSYRFAGEFQSGDLRSERGLAWVFSCASDGRELARTAPLVAGGRTWQPLAVSLEVPADCGLGVALALQTEAPFEAKTGLRGEVVFDRFTLVQAPATQRTSQP